MNKPINILVTGCNGRMGKAIINCASNHSEVLITKGIDIGDALDDYIDDCDVVIEYDDNRRAGRTPQTSRARVRGT